MTKRTYQPASTSESKNLDIITPTKYDFYLFMKATYDTYITHL